METGSNYNRHGYYERRLGRFIGKDPIGFAGGVNVYQYAPSPIQWLDPFALECIENSIKGDGRHRIVNERLSANYPNATIQCECYLRDSNGKSVYDNDYTNSRRRVDTVVIQDGKAQTYEITSLTADKGAQTEKEVRIIESGGTYIRDRKTKDLVPITGLSEIIREPQNGRQTDLANN